MTTAAARVHLNDFNSIPAADPTPDDASPAHSWTPIDLLQFSAERPKPPTIGQLCYPGRRHVLSGEPEVLKSWFVLVLSVEEIRKGNTVLFIDFEMSPMEQLERLRDLGLPTTSSAASSISPPLSRSPANTWRATSRR